MARVLGLGGVFVKARDRKALNAWYRDVLGIATDDYGAMFTFADDMKTKRAAFSVWGAMDADTSYFGPSAHPFMINLRVDDLDGMVARLEAKGVALIGRDDGDANGRFAWVLDPEGVKVELWEPKALPVAKRRRAAKPAKRRAKPVASKARAKPRKR